MWQYRLATPYSHKLSGYVYFAVLIKNDFTYCPFAAH